LHLFGSGYITDKVKFLWSETD